MKKLSRFIILAVFAISMVFASNLSARAAFDTMQGWGPKAYLFDTLEGGGISPFTFNVWAFVEYDDDPVSGTYNQYRYNYWVDNVVDGSGHGWQVLEIRLFDNIIDRGTIVGSGNQPVRAFTSPGMPGGPFENQNVFFARDDSDPAWLPEGLRSDTFWFTSFAGPGVGHGAGEGTGAGWVLNNPGTGRLPAPVPEPGTMALLGMGIVGIGFLKRARRKNSQNI